MSRQEIITNLYNSKEVDDCICKMVQAKHRQDFKQELFLVISEKDESFINDLWNKREIKFYIVRTIINLSRQKRNVFHKNYLDTKVNYDTDKLSTVELKAESDCIEERVRKEENEIRMIKKVHDLDQEMNTPAYRLMALLVNKLGSQREVARITGINVSIISRGLKKVRERICL